ncbi:MAG: hypothetical protein BWX71_02288 [Deltaproteobacteria bacterium ADurb.Bin072]|nr:MAG: hypothetical protein BWX71_02288 [Deltaproteobacteria bacterium ADurb.Bin072]
MLFSRFLRASMIAGLLMAWSLKWLRSFSTWSLFVYPNGSSSFSIIVAPRIGSSRSFMRSARMML